MGPDWMATSRGVWLAKMKAAYQPEELLEVRSPIPIPHTCTGVLCVRKRWNRFGLRLGTGGLNRNFSCAVSQGLAQLESNILPHWICYGFHTSAPSVQRLVRRRKGGGGLRWLPATTSAVALRMLELDSALAYKSEQVGGQVEAEEEVWTERLDLPKLVRGQSWVGACSGWGLKCWGIKEEKKGDGEREGMGGGRGSVCESQNECGF